MAVAVFVLGGVITKMLLFSPRIAIPQFLLDTKKPVHIIRRGSSISDMSSMAGSPFVLRTTMTQYYIEDVEPEQLIESLSNATAIVDEWVETDHYICSFGDISYDISRSVYQNQAGTVVLVVENIKSVSTLDLWVSKFAPFWADMRFGNINNTPGEIADRNKILPLDLKRIKKARPNTELEIFK